MPRTFATRLATAVLLLLLTTGAVSVGWVVGGQAMGGQVMGVLAGFLYLLLATAAMVALYQGFTLPIRRLARRLYQSDESGLTAQGTGSATVSGEVEQLEAAFDDMSLRLREQIARIERIESARRELVANVSHDLRTPLAALRGYLDTLILKNGALSAARRNEYLGIALRHSERLSKLVEELFELSKLESHETEPRREPFSIAELVQDNVQRYQIHASQRGVGLTANLREELPLVIGDLGLIERVLENLLENALRFTPEGGSVTVELDYDPAADRVVVVRMADTGCGIAESEIEHIFERYYKAKRSARPDHGPSGRGSGLGLAITKRILDLHGSAIKVESVPGAGSTFSFSLPVTLS